MPDLTVVIPFYNRADTVPLTLESIAHARDGLEVEALLVDDGSNPPAREQLRGVAHPPDRILRQENRGLLYARLAGLREARGEFVLFLDSDDLVGPDKFTAQLRAMRATSAPVSYTDTAQAELKPALSMVEPRPDALAAVTGDSATFFIDVQPVPHSPIFRTTWLAQIAAAPLFPPSPLYNPVAEIWFYHVASVHPVPVVKVAGAHTIIGHHPGARLTNHWEKLGVASLAVMEAFMRACPVGEETRRVRELVANRAFNSWRRLPYDFSREFDRRMIGIWRRGPRSVTNRLGGTWFARLARIVGPEAAGRAFRRLRGQPYHRCRTVADSALVDSWLSGLPPP